MFPDYIYGIFVVLIIIMAVCVIRAMKEDNDEFNRLLTIASNMPSGTTPKTHPTIWRKKFINTYGREPRGNSTKNIVKNTVLGTVRGCVLGLMTGGVPGAIKYAAIQGLASPTISNITEGWVQANSMVSSDDLRM